MAKTKLKLIGITKKHKTGLDKIKLVKSEIYDDIIERLLKEHNDKK